MRPALALCLLATLAGLAAASSAAAPRAARGACGKVSAGSSKWAVKVVGGSSCTVAIATLQTFVRRPPKPSRMIVVWPGGPKGYVCDIDFELNKTVAEGVCSKKGASFSWTKVRA